MHPLPPVTSGFHETLQRWKPSKSQRIFNICCQSNVMAYFSSYTANCTPTDQNFYGSVTALLLRCSDCDRALLYTRGSKFKSRSRGTFIHVYSPGAFFTEKNKFTVYAMGYPYAAGSRSYRIQRDGF